MSIEVSSLTKIYGEQKAVDGISFSVSRGEIAGFLGPNGAGKSTTMKIITGYLQQNEGRVSVCGINVNEQPIAAKRKTGYLPEANPLYYDMYVREYLDFIAGMHEVPNSKQRVEEVIGMVGLAPESKKKAGQLSKGYKQRLGLAAALIHDPEVLILDEPTSGLDPNQIIEIRELIRQLGKSKTVLFSSHILQEVEAICDRVVIINKGKLVADNAISLLRGNNPGNMIRIQFKEALEPAVLQNLSGVGNIHRVNDYQWDLETATPEETKKQLLALALQNNLNIVSLQSENRSLEDIFIQLTH